VIIALQNKKTRCFATKEGKWVAGLDEAITFKNTVEAEQYCKQLNLKETWILMKSNQGTDVTLPCNC
jgi:hypothetical protein